MGTQQAAASRPASSRLPSRLVDLATSRPMAAALLTYVAIRGACILVLAFWASSRHIGIISILGKHFDSVHYVSIATHGYSTMNLAFFPLFPMLIRAAIVLPVDPATAAVVIAWAGSLGAVTGIFKVGEHVGSRRTGLALVALWAVLPHALVESMAYTEGLFTAFAAWSLYFALRERWLLAGALCCLASLTRPTGLALVAALGIAAISAIMKGREWRALAAPLIGITGWIGYITWVGIRLGRADGWFWVQRHYWHSYFDAGRANLHELHVILVGHRISLMLYVVTAVVLCALLFFVLAASSGQRLVLVAYSAAMLLLTLGSNTGQNKARLLIPAFTLLLPPAAALAKVRAREAIAILFVLGAISAWFGGYLALIWRWSP